MKRVSKFCQVLFWILLTKLQCPQFVKISLRQVVSCYRPSAWRHPISLEFSGLVIAVQDRWWRPVYNLSNCLLHTWSLSLWHAVCLSSTLWHSQWDANVWNEDASMMSWCGLLDGRLHWWSEGHAEHIFVGAEDHYCCICQLLLIRSIHPKPGSLCQLWI